MNGMIPSKQRATILSFDSLDVLQRRRVGAAGAREVPLTRGVTRRRIVIGAGISALAVPFLALSRRENAPCGHARPVRAAGRAGTGADLGPAVARGGPPRRPERVARRCGVAFMVPLDGPSRPRTHSRSGAGHDHDPSGFAQEARICVSAGSTAPEAAPAAARLPYPGVMRLYAATGNAIARLDEGSGGRWTVELSLAGSGAQCLAADPRGSRPRLRRTA